MAALLKFRVGAARAANQSDTSDNPSRRARRLAAIAAFRGWQASPLVGEVGGGRPASAGQENLLLASSACADAALPPNPPHKGEGKMGRLARARAGVKTLATSGIALPAMAVTALTLDATVKQPKSHP
jgi:hypothetical protein